LDAWATLPKAIWAGIVAMVASQAQTTAGSIV
jgi:hypothetical protein